MTVLTIGDALRAQDTRLRARCVDTPMFCVQVCERIGPVDLGYTNGERMYHDHSENETYYRDRPCPEEWQRLKALEDAGNLPKHITVGGYVEKWLTVQACFTMDGYNRHLELNGHNYRHYYGTRIHVESFHRNPEMTKIREALIASAVRNAELSTQPNTMSEHTTDSPQDMKNRAVMGIEFPSRDAAISAMCRALFGAEPVFPDQPVTPQASAPRPLEAIVGDLVNRFLSWELPNSVSSDTCACTQNVPGRFGTNLLTADEARQMINHLLDTPGLVDAVVIDHYEDQLAELRALVAAKDVSLAATSRLAASDDSRLAEAINQLTEARAQLDDVRARHDDVARCLNELSAR